MILNLTQHRTTAQQRDQGISDLSPEDHAAWSQAITFTNIHTIPEQTHKAVAFAVSLARKYNATDAMIGGAMWLIAPLASALRDAGVRVWFAFSERRTVEHQNQDGTVTKTTVFEHAGLVPFIDKI